LFTFYVYDEGKKGAISDLSDQFLRIHQISGHLGADDLLRIVMLCNKCAEAGGKKTRSDKRVSIRNTIGTMSSTDTSSDANHSEISR
jgi:hypothetical protein